MNDFIVKTQGGIAQLTIARADMGNRLDVPALLALTAHLIELGKDPQVKVIHLRGDGKDFCLGRKVPEQTSGVVQARKTAMEVRTELVDPILGLYAAIRNIAVPTLATVSGSAFGLGCVLAARCDVTLADEDARFSLPELRSNIPPTLAMSGLLDAVSAKTLAHLVYSTSEISAHEALALGLVSHVTPRGELDAFAQQYLEGMASRTRVALSGVKEFLNASGHETQNASRYGANLLAAILSSQH
jgi:enoyl-CoA hydratase/carnithine racemase